jgi:PTS system ascorbate-specific IIA component
MLGELIRNKRVRFRQSIPTWQEAIRDAAEPLLEEGVIDERYIQAMIRSVDENGPYIVIAPSLAIPHARSDGGGVFGTAISFMKVEEPVHFSDSSEQDATLFFVIASEGHDAHLPLLKSLVLELSDDRIMEGLIKVKDIEELTLLLEGLE